MREDVIDPRPTEMFIVGYDRVALPESLADRYSCGDYSGLICFARNLADLVDLRQIATQFDEISALYGVQCESPALCRLPPILSVDHEGGRAAHQDDGVHDCSTRFDLERSGPSLYGHSKS